MMVAAAAAARHLSGLTVVPVGLACVPVNDAQLHLHVLVSSAGALVTKRLPELAHME